MQTLEASQGYYVIPEGDAFPLAENVEAIGLRAFLSQI